MSNELERILAEMEKDASDRVMTLPGANWRDWAPSIGGYFRGRREAGGQQAAGAAFQRLQANPHADAAAVERARAHLSPVAATQAAGGQSGVGGFFDRWGQRADAGRAEAAATAGQRQAGRDMAVLQKHAPAAHAAAVPPAAAAGKPGVLRRAAPYALGAAALGAGLYAGVRGVQTMSEQTARNSDYRTNAQHDMTTALPSMTVTASYDQFAAEKIATGSPSSSWGGGPLMNSAQAGAAASLTSTLGAKLIADPIDALHRRINKKFYDEPEWAHNFHDVVQSDPMLAQAHAENPNMLTDAFSSVKRFSPSLAKDRLATRNLLKHVVMSGGEMDHSVMKMLAETEQAVTRSKGPPR